MNERIRTHVRESHLDVYGLGADREMWERTVDNFTMRVLEEAFAEMARQMFLHCEMQAFDQGYQKAKANTLRKLSGDSNIKAGADIHAGDGGYRIGTQEAYEQFAAARNYHVTNTDNPVDFPSDPCLSCDCMYPCARARSRKPWD